MLSENKNQKPYVLVVDDWVDAANSLAELIQLLGVDAQAAYDGKSAIQMVHERKPDLILMDLAMPIMDGIEATQQLRGEPNSDFRIVALTAYGAESSLYGEAEGLFDKYLAKPADLNTIHSLLMAA